MAKKQYTPEEYKAKLDKKAEKNKRFSAAFLKVFAFCLAIAMVYCATSIAFTRTGLYSLGTSNTVATGSQNTDGGESVDEPSMDWGEDNTQTPSTDGNNNDSSNDANNTVNDNSGNTNNDAGSENAGGEATTPTADVTTSKTMQFDLFVKAFTGVKTNAKSATIVKKNNYNYDSHVNAGGVSIIEEAAKGLMGSLLAEEEVNETYTGADIAAEFPPSGATCGLTKEDVKNISCKEEGDYYIITVTVKGSKNPTAGKSVGAVASILTKESIQEPIKNVPVINSLEPNCDYKDTTAEAKIEKSTGNLVEYYFDLPMYLYLGEFSVGLGFEQWWTIAY